MVTNTPEMIKSRIKVKVPWWENCKKTEPLFGWLIGEEGGEYLVKVKDNSKYDIVKVYWDEMEITGIDF